MSAAENVQFKYPPRAYKTVAELALKENEDIRMANIDLLTVIDEGVHASTEGSKVVDFFRGKSVFVTGGTGFVGKLLLEKLLRTCKDIDTIYMMVRPKKGRNILSRIGETFDDQIFSELERANPKFIHKVVPIKGDISLPDLGITETDRQTLIRKVNVIFHVAATVRFNEKIRIAAAINVSGTKDVLHLAQQCLSLSSFVYVSTAYSFCPRREIEEKLYDPAYTTNELLRMMKTRTDRELERNKKMVLKGWPNTYSFTKAIAECTVKQMASGFPACIYRPGTITSTYKEPLRSWINNLYGPMGAIVGAGTGVVRSFHCDSRKVADIVPGDYVVNGMIAAAYQNQFNEDGEVKVYNYVSSPENPLTWGDFHDLSVYYGLQNPTVKSIWYYCNTMNKNYYIHLVSVFFLHFIPAFLIDFYFRITGRRPRMVTMYKKIHKFSSTLSFFSTKEWKYHNGNIQKLWNGLTEIDRKLFSFSMAKTDFNWNSYLSILGGGVRLYLLNDAMSTIPAAIKKYRRLYYYHKIFQGTCILIVLRLLFWGLSRVYNIFSNENSIFS